MEAILYILLSLCILGLVRISTVFLHEWAHAVLAIYYTSHANVEVFIGSTGENRKGFSWKWGRRLQFYFQFAPWKLKGGLCKYAPTGITWQQEIRILAAGSVVSLFLMIVASVISAYYPTGFWYLLSNFVLLSALIDFFSNLISRKKPFYLYDGTTQLNDIDQLKKVMETHHVKFFGNKTALPKEEVKKEEKIRKHRRPKQLPTVKGNRASDN